MEGENPSQKPSIEKKAVKKGGRWLPKLGRVLTSAVLAGAIADVKPPEQNYPPPPSVGQTQDALKKDISRTSELGWELLRYNQEIKRNPKIFSEIAPKIGSLALQYFNKEMGYNPDKYQGKFYYLWNDDYRERIQQDTCIETVDDNDYASVSASSGRQDILFNLTNILYKNRSSNDLEELPVLTLFGVSLHELVHATAPLISSYDNNGNSLPQKKRGVVWYQPSKDDIRQYLICYDVGRMELEEAIAHDATTRMLQPLGIELAVTGEYVSWVKKYRKEVVNKLFAGNHRPLLKLHQQSDQGGFFSLVGQKLGAPEDRALNVGSEYLDTLFTETDGQK